MTTTRSDSPDVNSSQTPSASPVRGGEQGAGTRNPFLAIGLFIRQVIAELRKVVVPTRKELIGYSVTVLAFVFVMIVLIFGLDFAFGWLARFAFVAPGAGA